MSLFHSHSHCQLSPTTTVRFSTCPSGVPVIIRAGHPSRSLYPYHPVRQTLRRRRTPSMTVLQGRKTSSTRYFMILIQHNIWCNTIIGNRNEIARIFHDTRRQGETPSLCRAVFCPAA